MTQYFTIPQMTQYNNIAYHVMRAETHTAMYWVKTHPFKKRTQLKDYRRGLYRLKLHHLNSLLEK